MKYRFDNSASFMIDIDLVEDKSSEEYQWGQEVFDCNEDENENEKDSFYNAIKYLNEENHNDNEKNTVNEFLNEINFKKETEFKNKREKKITAYDLALEIKEKNNIIIDGYQIMSFSNL